MKGLAKDREQPLDGLKVLDFTRLLPGPVCTMLLGDYGAEVIKVEDVNAGDLSRFVGPFIEGSGSFFRQLNRNKKSVALNLKTPEGKAIALKIAADCDVVVEGFRPGVMDRLGLGYDDLIKINPALVYAAITGYGQSGPYRGRAGHDLNFCALSGLLDLSAEENGAPVMPAVQLGDMLGGTMMAFSGILLALYSRERSGKGSFVDVSMTRGLLPLLAYAATGLLGDRGLPRRGAAEMSGGSAYFNIYETADGKYMSLCAVEPVFWGAFCQTAGREDWINLQHEKEAQEGLIAEIRAMFKRKSRGEWEEIFSGVEACCEPVLNLFEAIEHPVNADGITWIDGASIETGREKLTGFPLVFSGQPGSFRLPPPLHGQHTGEVLTKLGLSSEELSELETSGVIKR